MTRSLPLLLLLAACGPKDEDNPTLCSDRADNDQDGLVDCMEPACRAYCPPEDTGKVPPILPTTPTTDTPTSPTGTLTIDTGTPRVHLAGTVRLEEGLNPEGFRVELLNSGAPPTTTDRNGDWSLTVAAGTYPWRVTPPSSLGVPSTGTELTVRLPAGNDTAYPEGVDQVFDVLLPSFIVDVPLPLAQAQAATGLILTVPELTPVAGDMEAEGLGAIRAATPLPIEGVQDVHLMYHLRPFGHTGTIDVQFIYVYDRDMELWALNPVSGRWQSFGGFTDLGNSRIGLQDSLPWVTTLAIVTP